MPGRLTDPQRFNPGLQVSGGFLGSTRKSPVMGPSPTGEFVRHSDYLDISAERDALAARTREAKAECEKWAKQHTESQATLRAEGEQGRADQCGAAASAFQEIAQLLVGGVES